MLEERRTEPREEKPVRICRRCGGEIWAWEEFGEDGEGRAVCSDCAEDEWRELLPGEKLELLGYETRMITRREYY
ncbi:MAG: hypothetical protein IIZ91_05625 [Oscillospiraceae bacterium]|nr:hypothetical protein [Oscillospiraceae bacterium]MBQ1768577.1 hypothetical protein [Oscillospiraceae bacterium]MBQ2157540.1 hypothetical protein [Oscillospiraceae bacterium]MBQ2329867.1 hypothetical protein [Oscillospiraceae bacterium]